MGSTTTLAIRAEAGPSIGSGHVARMFALAETWVRRGGDAVLVGDPGHWRSRYETLGVEVLDGATAARLDPAWWAVDGYGLTQPSSRPTLVVDDFGIGGRRPAKVILDQNLGVRRAVYPADAEVLLGPRYALLRNEVRDAALERDEEGGDLVLVVVGGEPTPEVSAWAAAVGQALRHSGLTTEVLDGRRPIGEALSGASVALAAAGSVCWELLHVGVPTVVVSVAENQRRLAEALADAGVAIDLGRYDRLPPASAADGLTALARDGAERSALARRGRRIVDGLGSSRVATRLRSEVLDARRAMEADAQRLFEWRNDPTTAAASFNSDTVDWEHHVEWFRHRLQASDCDLLVVQEGDVPIGTARFDHGATDGAEISITVAPEHRNRSLAAPLIDAACRWLERARGRTTVVAQVRPENVASSAAFLAADFDPSPNEASDVLRYHRESHGHR